MAIDTTCSPTIVTGLSKPPCYTCWPNEQDGTTSCEAVQRYKKVFASAVGRVSGIPAMKNEIYQRGPISCGIEATDKMEQYSGGVFSDAAPATRARVPRRSPSGPAPLSTRRIGLPSGRRSSPRRVCPAEINHVVSLIGLAQDEQKNEYRVSAANGLHRRDAHE